MVELKRLYCNESNVQVIAALQQKQIIPILGFFFTFVPMKALNLIQTFTKKDWHWFEKFISSPLFNKNNVLIQWFLLLKQQKSKNAPISEKIIGLPAVQNSKEVANLHHTSNYFLKSIETYLSWEEWQNDEMEQLLYLLTACRKRNLERHFKEVHLRLERQMEKEPIRNPQFYRFKYRMAFEEHEQSMEAGRAGAEQLQALSDWQDVAFVAEKLKNGCILLSRRKVLNTSFEMGLLPSVLQFVQDRPDLLQYKAIAVYYYGYMALSEPQEESHFFALKGLLKALNIQFPIHELRNIYLLAVNFCINRINLRQDQYLRELLDLYQAGILAEVFIENGHISRFTYTNITLLALRMKEYNWVQHFIETYKHRLPESQRQGTHAFVQARYLCEIGDYDHAMPLLQTMDFDDILHNLMAKTMLLRMYYETGAFMALESLLASFTTYLRRKRQIADQQKTAYFNTIRFVRKLIALRPGNKKERMALKTEIAGTALVAEKDWLMERVGAG